MRRFEQSDLPGRCTRKLPPGIVRGRHEVTPDRSIIDDENVCAPRIIKDRARIALPHRPRARSSEPVDAGHVLVSLRRGRIIPQSGLRHPLEIDMGRITTPLVINVYKGVWRAGVVRAVLQKAS